LALSASKFGSPTTVMTRVVHVAASRSPMSGWGMVGSATMIVSGLVSWLFAIGETSCVFLPS
jgi:hypothetical protein